MSRWGLRLRNRIRIKSVSKRNKRPKPRRRKNRGKGGNNPSKIGTNSITRYGKNYTSVIRNHNTSKYLEQIKAEQYFDCVAKEYDKFYSNALSITENKHVKELIDIHLGGLKSEKILDLGCGTGLLNTILPECRNIVGVDISKKMLRQARYKHPHGKFKQRDIVSTGLQDNSVEVVISLFGSLAYSNFDEVMLEVDRVLVDGGCAFLMHYNRFSLRNFFRCFSKKRKYQIRYCDMKGLRDICPDARMLSSREIKKTMSKYLTAVDVIPLYDYKMKMFPHNLIGMGVKQR